jgi:glucose-1-phosphate cytidylyltransferase
MRPGIFDVLREGEDIVPHALNRLYPMGQLMAQRYTGFWRAIDTFKDRAEAEDLCRRGTAPWMLWRSGHRLASRPTILTPESDPLSESASEPVRV